jgi:fibronectin type 3 domain-containing protein
MSGRRCITHYLVHRQADDGKFLRTINILEEFSKEYLAINVDQKLNSTNLIGALFDLFIMCAPHH